MRLTTTVTYEAMRYLCDVCEAECGLSVSVCAACGKDFCNKHRNGADIASPGRQTSRYYCKDCAPGAKKIVGKWKEHSLEITAKANAELDEFCKSRAL